MKFKKDIFSSKRKNIGEDVTTWELIRIFFKGRYNASTKWPVENDKKLVVHHLQALGNKKK